jgi:ABC-type dipeptide/oligopeptide/nickel transport systems, permease components
MLRFILRRLAGMVLVLFACSVLVFVIFMVAPGGGSDAAARRIAGKNATPQLIANVRKDFGFDKSLPVQYTTMMKKVFTGSLVSYSSQLNVDDEIRKGVPATFSIVIGAALLWLFFGIVFGYLSAVRAGGFTDRALTVVALVGISIPVFLLAAFLLYYLTFKLTWFPNGDYTPLTQNPLDWAYHLILPWTALTVLYIGFYSRVLRSNMLDVMNEDYVRTARAKGLSEQQVRIKHVLRNALIPIVTIFGLDFGAVIGGGDLVIESIFNIHGVGYFAAQAISNQDLPPIMAVTLLGAFFIVFFNALVDIAYAYLDPRIRLGTDAAGAAAA